MRLPEGKPPLPRGGAGPPSLHPSLLPSPCLSPSLLLSLSPPPPERNRKRRLLRAAPWRPRPRPSPPAERSRALRCPQVGAAVGAGRARPRGEAAAETKPSPGGAPLRSGDAALRNGAASPRGCPTAHLRDAAEPGGRRDVRRAAGAAARPVSAPIGVWSPPRCFGLAWSWGICAPWRNERSGLGKSNRQKSGARHARIERRRAGRYQIGEVIWRRLCFQLSPNGL